VDHNRVLTKDEVELALKRLKIPITTIQVDDIFREYNEDNDSGLNIDEFTKFVHTQQEKLTHLFEKIDLNKDGVLDAFEIETIYEQNFGLKLGRVGKEKVRELIALVDTNQGKNLIRFIGNNTGFRWNNFFRGMATLFDITAP
jgi:Ca2+-binding EF-hand superfamily protein